MAHEWKIGEQAIVRVESYVGSSGRVLIGPGNGVPGEVVSFPVAGLCAFVPPSPHAALRDAVVAEAIKLVDNRSHNSQMPWPRDVADLAAAVDALRTAMAPADPVAVMAEALTKIKGRADRNHTGCNPQLLGDDVTAIVNAALAAVEAARKEQGT